MLCGFRDMSDHGTVTSPLSVTVLPAISIGITLLAIAIAALAPFLGLRPWRRKLD